MHSLADYIRLYFIIEIQYIKARMQYRADFLISSIGMFFSSLVTLGVFWIILESVPDLAGWSLMEMVFIYAFYMIAISPMQILFDHAWQIRFHIQQGTFIKYYFRPINMMFYYMSEMFDVKGLTQLIVGTSLLVYSSIQLKIDWTPIRLILLLITLFSASLVQISIIVSASCAAFWVLDSYPVLGLAWKLREFSPYDHLRWRLPLHLHLPHPHRLCGVLSLATFPPSRRGLALHLLLSHHWAWTFRCHLLDMEERY